MTALRLICKVMIRSRLGEKMAAAGSAAKKHAAAARYTWDMPRQVHGA
jgi:hypothetical protein